MLASVGRNSPSDGPWDVVVVGGGIAGLVSASCLARQGRQVALLEAGAAVGGYLASFQRRGVVFDTCVDAVGSVFETDGSPGLLGIALEAAGVLDDVAWVELDPVRVQRFPGRELAIPRGLTNLQESLAEAFSESRFALRRALEEMAAIHGRTRRAFGLSTAVRPALGFRDAPFGEFLGRFPLTYEAAAALASYATFLGLNPGRASTRAMADLWMSYAQGGAWRVVGGFGRLVDALAARIRRAGGQITERCPVSAVAQRRDGWDLRTPDGTVTARRLVWAAPPLEGANGGRVSSSFAILYAGAKEASGVAPSTGIFPSASVDSFLLPDAPWRGAGGVSLALPTEGKSADGIAPLVVHWPVDPSVLASTPKEDVHEALLQIAEQVAPAVSISWSEAATPATLERYTGNPGGAAYGWEQSAEAIAGPQHWRTPAAGFARAGHWAGLGGGVIPAALSGWRAARSFIC